MISPIFRIGIIVFLVFVGVVLWVPELREGIKRQRELNWAPIKKHMLANIFFCPFLLASALIVVFPTSILEVRIPSPSSGVEESMVKIFELVLGLLVSLNNLLGKYVMTTFALYMILFGVTVIFYIEEDSPSPQKI